MKSIKKFIFVMAALAAVFAFVSCSNGSDDGGSSNNNNSSSNDSDDGVVAIYENNEYGITIEFFNDYTWKLIEAKIIKEMGTYTGNPSKDGKVKVVVTKGYDGFELVDLKYLVDEDRLDEYIDTLIIKNGETDWFGVFTLTRQ